MIGSITIPAGATYSMRDVPAGAAIGVSPGIGGSMSVEYRVTGDGPLRPWAAGVVTADADDYTRAPCTEMVFTAIDADGFAEWLWIERVYP